MTRNPIVFTERVVRSFLRYQLTPYPFADERLLRLSQDGRLKTDVRGVELDTLGITTDDIQMAGPALLLDVETPKHRVLMWTQ